jgi:hypothetical protein
MSDNAKALLGKAVNEGIAVSSTKQICLDSGNGILKVDTPLTQSVTLPKGEAAASVMSVKNVDTLATVAAISLDGAPLKNSSSIIVFHLTDVCNSEIRFSNATKTLLLNKGKLPLLVRRGKAEISLATGRRFKVEALNCDGAVKGEVKGSFANGNFSFEAKTDIFPGGIMVYHLTPAASATENK